jgi:hypothetical protein
MQGGVRADDQDFGNSLGRIADVAEELVLAAHPAAVSAPAVEVFRHPSRKNSGSVELKDLRAVMIDPDDSVEEWHEESRSKWINRVEEKEFGARGPTLR